MAVDTRERPINRRGLISRRLNIKNLIVEEPVEVPRAFDTESEITLDDWQVIDGYIEQYPLPHTSTASLLADIKILSPERFLEYELTEPTNWEEYANPNDTWSQELYAPSFVAIYKNARQKLNLSEDFYGKLLRNAKGQGNFYGIDDVAILVPERLSELATDEYKDLGLSTLKELARRDDYGQFVRIGASFKLLFPGANVGITNNIWDGMRKRLRYEMEHALGQKAKYWEDWSPGGFVAMAKFMKILAADEVQVDKDGIHLIFNPKMTAINETPQIPESKKF